MKKLKTIIQTFDEMNDYVKRTSNQPTWSYDHDPETDLLAIWQSSIELDIDAVKQWCHEAEQKYNYRAPDIDWVMANMNSDQFANIRSIYSQLRYNRNGNKIISMKDDRYHSWNQQFPEFKQMVQDYECWGKMMQAIVWSKDYEKVEEAV